MTCKVLQKRRLATHIDLVPASWNRGYIYYSLHGRGKYGSVVYAVVVEKKKKKTKVCGLCDFDTGISHVAWGICKLRNPSVVLPVSCSGFHIYVVVLETWKKRHHRCFDETTWEENVMSGVATPPGDAEQHEDRFTAVVGPEFTLFMSLTQHFRLARF